MESHDKNQNVEILYSRVNPAILGNTASLSAVAQQLVSSHYKNGSFRSKRSE